MKYLGSLPFWGFEFNRKIYHQLYSKPLNYICKLTVLMQICDDVSRDFEILLLLHKQWGLIGRTISIYKIKEAADPIEVDFHKDVVNHNAPGLSDVV